MVVVEKKQRLRSLIKMKTVRALRMLERLQKLVERSLPFRTHFTSLLSPFATITLH